MIVMSTVHVCDRCKRQGTTDYGRPEGWRESEERDAHGCPTRTHLCPSCSAALTDFMAMVVR